MGCSSFCVWVTWVTGQRAVVAGCEALGLQLPGAPPCCSRPRPQALFQGLRPAGLRRGGQEPGGAPSVAAAAPLCCLHPQACRGGRCRGGQRAAPGQGRFCPATPRGPGGGSRPVPAAQPGPQWCPRRSASPILLPRGFHTHLQARGPQLWALSCPAEEPR